MDNKKIRLIAVGNSFSDDCLQHVYFILKDMGFQEIVVGNLYIGGCPVSSHIQNLSLDAAVYEYRINRGGEWENISCYKASDALKQEEWDFVFTQQFSGESGLEETYKQVDALYGLIKKNVKASPKFGWQMTWAYPQHTDHPWFERYDNSQEKMWKDIQAAVKKYILPRKDVHFLIPSGEAVQKARMVFGDTLNRDGCHLTYMLGRYIAGLCVAGAVTGESIANVSWAPEGVDEMQKAVAKAVALSALEKWKIEQ